MLSVPAAFMKFAHASKCTFWVTANRRLVLGPLSRRLKSDRNDDDEEEGHDEDSDERFRLRI